MKLSYPAYVDKDLIMVVEDQGGLYRYSLNVSFQNKSLKQLLVILKNPSIAGSETSDPTANQIFKYAYANGYGQVTIANLFAYRSTDSKELKKVTNEKQPRNIIGIDNDDYIKRAAKTADDIIVAWGVYPQGFKKEYDERIKQILVDLKDYPLFYVHKLSQGQYPLHAQVWPNAPVRKDFRQDVTK